MENPEGVLNLLDEFAKLKSTEIPNDLEEYLSYVAASGDPVYQWSLIKSLYRQKLINVITEFYEMCPVVEIPRCPNVDPFNYETMKNSLLKRLDSFSSAPFTIQRISELLTTPRKQYNRVDKFMRAIEKNIWVVSTREPGTRDSNAQSQETSSNLVNGVTPRVSVTVKHPKRVKSIEERIKSGHPQLIDDEEEEEEEEEEKMNEYKPMEEENHAEMLPNNEPDDSSLQCTSVKDLIDKYENGTIFSNAEEKSDFEDKSGQFEDAGVTLATVTTNSTIIASTSTFTTTTTSTTLTTTPADVPSVAPPVIPTPNTTVTATDTSTSSDCTTASPALSSTTPTIMSSGPGDADPDADTTTAASSPPTVVDTPNPLLDIMPDVDSAEMSLPTCTIAPLSTDATTTTTTTTVMSTNDMTEDVSMDIVTADATAITTTTATDAAMTTEMTSDNNDSCNSSITTVTSSTDSDFAPSTSNTAESDSIE